MKTLLHCAAILAAVPTLLQAVYAPIPEPEQGEALVFRLGAGISHDSNIFGSATNEIDSMVYSFSPSVSVNSSVTDQTFVSFGYDLNVDHFEDRPGKRTLTSHAFNGRLAHQFSEDSNIDVSETYQISKNPQSLLSGVPLNTDQSLQSNQFNARLTAAAGQKTGLLFKLRHLTFSYDNASLAASLDRAEALGGIELSYAYLQETKIVGEYRYQDISYDTGGAFKDKYSHYLMAGIDHQASQQMKISGRLGFEDRTREGAGDTTAPYAELSLRYNFGENSFLAAGYGYSIDEPSDTIRFTDSKVNRLFANLQHRISALVTASGSLTYEPAQLQGRTGIRDIDETTTRAGFALTWLPGPRWMVGATLDLDRVSSDDPNREQDRARFGVNARLSF